MRAILVNIKCDCCSAPCVEKEEPGPRQTKTRRWRSPNLDKKTAATQVTMPKDNGNNVEVKQKLKS